jgi:D-tyrosyl-tRNA(Tyr) deacylase
VDGQLLAEIGKGFVLLVGIGRNDTEKDLAYAARKCAGLRIFEDKEGKMNRSVLDIRGEALAISQFTLYADTRRGRRPGFIDAAPPEVAEPLYGRFVELLRSEGVPTKTGIFAAHMLVEIHNDGPVTFIIDVDQKRPPN